MDFSMYLNYLNDGFESPELFVQRVLITLLLMIGIGFISRLLTRLIRHTTNQARKANQWIRWKRLVVTVINLLIIFHLWAKHMDSLALIIAIIAFLTIVALRGMIVDIVAFIYSTVRKQIHIGDRIEIDGKIGDVIDMDVFQIHMMEVGELLTSEQGTGRSIAIPNRMLFDRMMINYSFQSPFIRQDVRLLIGFDSDREQAIQIAGKVAYQRHEAIMEKCSAEAVHQFENSLQLTDSDLKPQVRIDLAPNGFYVVVTYFSDYHNAAANRSYLSNDLYDAFQSRGFHLPVPNYLSVHSAD